jgi:hypothetical protein
MSVSFENFKARYKARQSSGYVPLHIRSRFVTAKYEFYCELKVSSQAGDEQAKELDHPNRHAQY